MAAIRGAMPEFHITGRPEKTPDSIVAKLRRTKTELARMQDIAGCRLLVDQIEDQDGVVARLSSMFVGARIVDRRVDPSFGYRAVHVIPTVEGRQVEIQVRTFPQHLWATVSESLSDSLGQDLKYGGRRPELDASRRYLDRASAMIAIFETGETASFLREEPLERSSGVMGAALAIMTLAAREDV
ncbi:MAG TPA: RelA/SpoT domain-containing protein [Candidatus Dormibacteraeota bacterium]|nr:RelA/SpoT domain-containing protein [Candidatus Dormibacteraeota bacterium]